MVGCEAVGYSGTDALPEGALAVPSTRYVIGVRVVGRALELEVPPSRPVAWIGTDASCDLRLTSTFVSARHCTVERQGTRLVCRDQKSTNGLWLGNERVPELEVKADEAFRVGDMVLVGLTAEAQSARRNLQRWLGYAERFQAALDDALRVAAERRHVVITGALGGQQEALARALHDTLGSLPRPMIEAATVAPDAGGQRALLERARGGTLMLPVSALPIDTTFLRDRLALVSTDVRVMVIAPPELVARACTLASGIAVLDVPPIEARRDDLAHLVFDVAGQVVARRRWSGVDIAADMPALLRHAWAGNLAELEESIERVLAVRVHGSIRAAEEATGVSKSALGRTLKRLGIVTKDAV
jgi:hypothetical protein